ncbi:MAG: FlgD immunoglobulin-like domain containing protein, partial [Actinomycetota bacterium]
LVRGVWIDSTRFDVKNNRIVVTGHVRLRGPAKVVPRTDVLELRINKGSVWDVNDRPGRIDRRVDIGAQVQRNGTWRRVLRSSRADVLDARADSEIFLEWSAGTGAVETEIVPEITVFDGAGGEAIDCPPFLEVPSAPKLARADDTNAKRDHVTRKSRALNFSGDTGQVGPSANVKLFVNGDLKRSVQATNGAYSFGSLRLKARRKPHRLMVRAKGGSAPVDSKLRMVKVDRFRPRVNLSSVSPSRILDLSGSRALKATYKVNEAATLRAWVVNSAGRAVKSFNARKLRSAGREQLGWNGKNNLGRNVGPGRYTMKVKVTDRAGNKRTNREAHMSVVR